MTVESPKEQELVGLKQMLSNSSTTEVKPMKDGSVLILAGNARERIVLTPNQLTEAYQAWKKLLDIPNDSSSHWLNETLENPEDFLNCMVPSDLKALPIFLEDLTESIKNDSLNDTEISGLQLEDDRQNTTIQFRRLPSVVVFETPFIYFSLLTNADGTPRMNSNVLPVIRYLFQSGNKCRICAIQGGKSSLEGMPDPIQYNYESVRDNFIKFIINKHKGTDISVLIEHPNRGVDFDLIKHEKDALEIYAKVKKDHDEEVLRDRITDNISKRIKASKRFDRSVPPLHLASAAAFIIAAHNQGKREFDFALDLFLQPHTSQAESGDPIDRHIDQLFRIARELSFQIPGSFFEENGGCVRLILPDSYTFSNSFLEELRTK